jgi:hypothetical protein
MKLAALTVIICVAFLESGCIGYHVAKSSVRHVAHRASIKRAEKRGERRGEEKAEARAAAEASAARDVVPMAVPVQ